MRAFIYKVWKLFCGYLNGIQKINNRRCMQKKKKKCNFLFKIFGCQSPKLGGDNDEITFIFKKIYEKTSLIPHFITICACVKLPFMKVLNFFFVVDIDHSWSHVLQFPHLWLCPLIFPFHSTIHVDNRNMLVLF